MNTDILLQKRLIATLLKSDILMDFQDKISPEYFSQVDFRWFYDKIFDFYKQNGMKPNEEHVAIMIVDDFKDKDQQDKKLVLLKNIMSIETDRNEVNFLITSLKNHFLLDNLHTALDKTLNDVSVENIESKYIELKGQLETTIVKANDVNIVREKLNYLTCINSYVEKKKNTEDGVKSGIKKLDDLTGGWRKSELIFIAAPSGEGKSAVLLNFARNAWVQGTNVLFITLELSREEVIERYSSLIGSLSHQEIRNKNLNSSSMMQLVFRNLREFVALEEHDRFLNEFKLHFKELNDTATITNFMTQFKKRTNVFDIVDIPRNCTMNMLERELLKALNEHPVDIVILDHYNLLVAEHWTKDYWLDIGTMSRELKGIAKQYKVPILTAVQMKFMKDGEQMDPSSVKYSQMIVHNADFILGFSRSQEDKILNRIKIELIKHRSTKNEEILLKEDFEKMNLSEYMEDDGSTTTF